MYKCQLILVMESTEFFRVIDLSFVPSKGMELWIPTDEGFYMVDRVLVNCGEFNGNVCDLIVEPNFTPDVDELLSWGWSANEKEFGTARDPREYRDGVPLFD